MGNLRGGDANAAGPKKQNVQNGFLFLDAKAKNGMSILDKSTGGGFRWPAAAKRQATVSQERSEQK